ncbi:hypothetical protein [Acidovorax temperans]
MTGRVTPRHCSLTTLALDFDLLAMLHLHHCVSARSFRPLWMLEELQLP